MRVAVGEVRVEPDRLQQLLHALVAVAAIDEVMDLHRLGDDRADRHARVERGVRVLEDHLHVAAHLAHVARVQLRQVLALELHLAGGRLVELQDGAARRALAAAGFADQSERLALLDGEGDTVHGLHRADLALHDDAAREREVHDEVIDLKERFAKPGVAVRARLCLGPRCRGGLLCHYDTFSPFTMLNQHAIS